MPRPHTPLIRYDAVIDTSLRIIDTKGLDAFSMPRLARELNVRAPSLHHPYLRQQRPPPRRPGVPPTSSC